jgi:plasmid stabilization system protein ParE
LRKYDVEITRRAESDIKEIFGYILKDNRTAAIKWVAEIERQIESLENFPLRCAVIPEVHEMKEKYRHLIYGAYRTIFRIEEARVIIMRVIHSSRLLDLKIFKK